MEKVSDHSFRPVTSVWLRYLLIAIGSISVVLGIIGVFLPLLPTTPFMILAAACFAKSSERFYLWVVNNKVFGATVRQWRQEKTIPRKAKWVAFFTIILSFSFSIYMFRDSLQAQLILVTMSAFLIFFMSRVPVRKD